MHLVGIPFLARSFSSARLSLTRAAAFAFARCIGAPPGVFRRHCRIRQDDGHSRSRHEARQEEAGEPRVPREVSPLKESNSCLERETCGSARMSCVSCTPPPPRHLHRPILATATLSAERPLAHVPTVGVGCVYLHVLAELCGACQHHVGLALLPASILIHVSSIANERRRQDGTPSWRRTRAASFAWRRMHAASLAWAQGFALCLRYFWDEDEGKRCACSGLACPAPCALHARISLLPRQARVSVLCASSCDSAILSKYSLPSSSAARAAEWHPARLSLLVAA